MSLPGLCPVPLASAATWVNTVGLSQANTFARPMTGNTALLGFSQAPAILTLVARGLVPAASPARSAASLNLLLP